MDVLGINVENLGHGEQVVNRKEPRPVDYVTECERMKKKIEFEEVREEYLKEEMRNLRQEYIHAQNEVKRIASIPLMIGHFLEGIDPNTCIVAPTSGQNYYVRLGFIRLSFGTMLASVNP